MAGEYWIKLYHEILDDPKMATLPDKLWRRTVELFLLAGRTRKDGQLPDTNKIAWSLRMDEKALSLDLEQLATAGFIETTDDGWVVTNFKKRQEKMSDAERAQKYRDEKKRNEYYGERHEIVTNVTENVTQITDNRSDTDNRSEEDTALVSPVQSIIERLAGIIINPGEIPILLRIEKMEPLEEDVTAALEYLKSVNVTVYKLSQLENPIKVAKAKRIQALIKPQSKSQSVTDKNNEFLKQEMAEALQQEAING